eukprot:TRINITY_DN91868_c0_g1_i1.p2 TRINITY_DN91868_c0_g1~~TRINITY_DN91868_c0_g1_i1.p2  ORF type:complete len:216 (-),score=77.83 TRINITY_DN91868_c0_g1_i1:338-985(-)
MTGLSILRPPGFATAATLAVFCLTRAVADADWIKYADGELPLPQSASWREKMRKELQALGELTPALKMKRVKLIRRFDAEDARLPESAEGETFDPDDLAAAQQVIEDAAVQAPAQYSTEQVAKGIAGMLVLVALLSYAVPKIPEMLMSAGAASASSGSRRRAAAAGGAAGGNAPDAAARRGVRRRGAAGAAAGEASADADDAMAAGSGGADDDLH